MGISHRNDDIQSKMLQMQRAREDYADALAADRQFNARLSAKGSIWSWPTVAAAITAKYPWLVIECDSSRSIIDLD
jgi:hypothetical protein